MTSCQSCEARRARLRSGLAQASIFRPEQDQTLCFECYRNARERRRALAVREESDEPHSAADATNATGEPDTPTPDGCGGRHTGPSLGTTAGPGTRAVAHRRVMLAHLETARRGVGLPVWGIARRAEFGRAALNRQGGSTPGERQRGSGNDRVGTIVRMAPTRRC